MIWVTGGAGFLGSHVVDALIAQGHVPTILDDFSTGEAANLNPAASVERINLLDPALTTLLQRDQPQIIYHLAGDALVSRSVQDPLGDCQRNLQATLVLLDAIRTSSPATKLLFASTGAVYGESAARPFHEADPVQPISPYAVAKLAAERYCFAFAHTYGLRTASLRLFSVYGPRQRKQVVYDLIRKLHHNPGELTLFGDGTQERDFSHARNIVDAFLLAAAKADFHGEVINVAGDEIVTIAQLAQMLCAICNVQPEIHYTGQRRPGDSQRWIADTTRLRALGYTPGIQLSQGLADTVEWFRKHPA